PRPHPAAPVAPVRQPNGGFNRSVLRTQPTVEVRDSAGNVVAASGITVTSSVDGATTSVKTDSAGLATFTSVVSSGLVGKRRVTFTSLGLSSVTSAEFELVAGPTTQIVATSASISGPQGIVIPNAQTRDVDGNLTTTDAFQIIASVASNSGESWLLGNRVSTISGGTASFASTRVSSTASSATITYTVSGRTTKTSVPVTFIRELVPGNFGPTGGVIIYAARADQDEWSRPHKEAGFSSGGRYVEVAPPGWSGSATDPKMAWSSRVPPRTLVSYGSIGFASTVTRYYNTYLQTISSPSRRALTSAIMTVADKFAFDKDDWLLPTIGEVELMLEYAAGDNRAFGLSVDSATNSTKYLTSTVDCCEYGQLFESVEINMISGAGSRIVDGLFTDQAYVRPVRYFG
ncbi:MAG: carboxypeptidase-like regulatory domain-containing protein, partial [Ilumatobacteraceae bacterium]